MTAINKDINLKRKYNREWMAKRRNEFFKDKKCSNCGSIEKLHLHHLNPLEKIDHKIWSWRESRRKIEIAKCIILCRKCHLTLHAKQRSRGLIHGTQAGHAYYGCRCDKCKAAHNEHVKNWRRNKMARQMTAGS